MSSLIQRPQVAPPALNYNIPVASPIVNRSTVKIPPSNGSTFQKNGKIIIDIPANGFWDAQNSYLSFHSAVDDGTAGTKKFASGGLPWCRRLRISTGRNETIEDIQDYNKLEHLLVNLTGHSDWVESTGEITAGYNNNDVTLNNYAAGKQHCVHLGLSGMLSSAKYWPLLVTDGCRMEFFLDDVDSIMNNSNNDTTNYTVKFVNMVCDFVDVSDAYMNEFMSRLNSAEGIKMHVPTYLSTSNNISGAAENVKITEAIRSIKSVYCTMRETADLSDQTVDSFATRQYDLDRYQFRFGNKYYPQQEVQCGGNGAQTNEGVGASEALCELMKSFNKHGGVDEGSQLELSAGVTGCRWSDGQDGGGDGTDNTSECFAIGQQFELDPNNRLSGVDGNRRILDLALKFEGAPANALTLQSYVYYDSVVLLDSNSAHIVF